MPLNRTARILRSSLAGRKCWEGKSQEEKDARAERLRLARIAKRPPDWEPKPKHRIPWTPAPDEVLDLPPDAFSASPDSGEWEVFEGEEE